MKKISYYLIFIVVMGVILVSFWAYQKYFKQEEANLLLFNVERGNIQDVIKVRGEVVPQKEFDLEFTFSGIVEKIFVREGQEVSQGNALMKLETVDFELEVKTLEALLAQNQANLDKLIAGATEEDIKVLETKVSNAQKSVEDAELNLKNVKDKATSDLDNNYDDVLNILNDAYIKADDALHKQVDELLINDDSNSPQLSFSISDGQLKSNAESQRITAGRELNEFSAEIDNLSSDFSSLDQALIDADNHLTIIGNFLNQLNDALNIAIGLSSATVSTYKSNVNTGRTNVNTAISNISDKKQAIATQKVTNQNNIASAEAGLNDEKSALSLAREELNLKKAGARSEDLEIARAKIRETESQIKVVQEKIKKSILYSPGSAKIIKISFEKQELFRPGQTAISLFASGYKIQTDVSELEIGKVREVDGNDVLIQLDAFSGQEFKGTVVSIEPKEIIKEGDKYYRLNIYLEEYEKTIRSGMSADLVINISSKENVLKIPELVIYEKDGKKFVKILEENLQKEMEIETGISDGEFIEVTKGLKEGQTIVVSAD